MESRRATFTKHFAGATPVLRPILTSLNGDNSWLISIPRPYADRQSAGKAFFHIVSDAWLSGTGIPLLSKWMASLDLVAQPAVADGDAVEAVIQEIENAASVVGTTVELNASDSCKSGVDAIFVNLHVADHLSKETLTTFGVNVPVFATPDAAPIIQSWKHFHTVEKIKDYNSADTNWQGLHPGAPLPEWLHVFRLPGHHYLNFAIAIVFTSDSGQYEAILYSPHGILCDQPSICTFPRQATPPVSTLAMLHGLKESFAWGIQTTLGVTGGLALERLVRPKYWIKSHDSPIHYGGPVLWGVKDVYRSLEWGLEEEKKNCMVMDQTNDLTRPNLIEIDNGECFVLE
jgi:hypothetical protein